MISHIITFVAGIAIGNITAVLAMLFFAGCREPKPPDVATFGSREAEGVMPAGRSRRSIFDRDELRLELR
jgi:hypothetical protein